MSKTAKIITGIIAFIFIVLAGIGLGEYASVKADDITANAAWKLENSHLRNTTSSKSVGKLRSLPQPNDAKLVDTHGILHPTVKIDLSKVDYSTLYNANDDPAAYNAYLSAGGDPTSPEGYAILHPWETHIDPNRHPVVYIRSRGYNYADAEVIVRMCSPCDYSHMSRDDFDDLLDRGIRHDVGNIY